MGREVSGMLRERMSIGRQSLGRDGLGSAEPQYLTVGVFWAAAEALQGGTASEAESRSAMPRWRFTLRETQVIRPGDRLVYLGNVIGRGGNSTGAVDQVLGFRRAVIGTQGMFAGDVAILRGWWPV